MRYWICIWIFSPLVVCGTFLDVRFDVHLQHVLKECRHKDSKCQLSYAISLLQSQATYELAPLMLQDGTLYQTYGKRHFSESTIVKVPPTRESESDLYLGIKFYGFPPSAQDYYILDASRSLSKNRKNKISLATNSLVFTARVKNGKKSFTDSRFNCACEHDTCGCCEHLDIEKLSLNDTGCVNITYLPREVGIDLSFSINGHIYYEERLSVVNPPPVCFGVPHLKEYASVCLRLYNLNYTQETFSGCVELEAELYHVKVAQYKMGCFNIGPLANQIE